MFLVGVWNCSSLTVLVWAATVVAVVDDCKDVAGLAGAVVAVEPGSAVATVVSGAVVVDDATVWVSPTFEEQPASTKAVMTRIEAWSTRSR